MIKSAATAARIEELVREAYNNLNESIRVVQDTEDDEAFKEYRRRAGYVMAGLYE